MSLEINLHLQRATHRVGLVVEQLVDVGVTQGEAHVLAHLHDVRTATISELHAALAHKRSTLTSILDRLAARALVARDTHAADRRTFVVSLTPEGEVAAAVVHARFAELEDRVVARTSTAQRKGFAAVLAALVDASAEEPELS